MKKIILFLLTFIFLFGSCKDDKNVTTQEEELVIPDADRWWNDDVFYEILVRSFYDSDGDGIGDFKGIIEKLDYLNDGDPTTNSDLGISGIWLMPIFPSPSYHGYDVTDYRNVNGQYGSLDDFKLLLQEAHKRGIKVIIDFVINHTSDQHTWFSNSASGPSAAKRNWYIWASSNPGYNGPWGQPVWYEKNGTYYYAVFWSGMPDLNYKNDDVTQEIKTITQFWYKEIGVDGFRFDAAKHLIESGQTQENTSASLAWWRKFYAFEKNMDPALMTVGEVWSSTAAIAPYTDQRMDYCFEFDLSYAIMDATKNGNAANLKNKMNEVVESYPALQYGTFLTNHDQNRVFEELNQDVNKSKLAAAILLTLPGIPYLYYGEEIGMRGVKPDEDIRKPMQWTNGTNAGFTSGSPWHEVNSNYTSFNVETLQGNPTSLWNQYKNFVHARQNSEALKRGSYHAAESSVSTFGFLRVSSDETILAIHNLSPSAQNGASFSISKSELTAGTYSITNKFSGADLGTISVNANGGFSNFSPVSTLDGYASYLIKFIKQ